jgi:Domain of unknown function (DUF6430)
MINRLSLVFSDFFTRSHWLNIILTKKTFDDVFAAVGKIWLLINVTSLFLPTTKPYLSDNLYLFIGVIFVMAIWVSRPRLSVINNVKNCDMQIEIQVGNLFDFRGAYVIGTNSTFDVDTSTGVISPESLQGQFSSRFYKNNFSELDADLERALNGLKYDELNDGRVGNKKRYPLGTVAQLKKSKKIFYMTAIANLNSHGSIEDSSFENIQHSLSELWKKVDSTGNIDPLVIPLLGSLRCRLKQSRNDFVKEIINSYAVACMDKKLCEKLIIVISPQDYRKHEIDFEKLKSYLNCKCTFPELTSSPDKPENP